MPLIINEETTMQDLQKQLTKNAQDHKRASYFHAVLTGDGLAARGLYHRDKSDINVYTPKILQKLFDKTGKHGNQAYTQLCQYNNVDNFFRNKPLDESQNNKMTLTSHLLTTSINPAQLSMDHTANMLQYIPNQQLTVPNDIHLYNMNHIDKWTTVLENDDYKTNMHLIIPSVLIYEQTFKDSNTGKKKTDRIVHHTLYVALATYKKDQKISQIVITANPDKKLYTPETAVVTIHPIQYDIQQKYGLSNQHLISAVTKHTTNNLLQPNITVNEMILKPLILNKNLGQCLSNQAEETNTYAESIIKNLINSYINQIIALNMTPATWAQNIPMREHILSQLAYIVQTFDILNHYNPDILTTSGLADIYMYLINSTFDKNEITSITKHSLRLHLSQCLNTLSEKHKQGALYRIPNINPAVEEKWKKDPNYSQQQKQIIMSKDSLLIGQAGAGSGKSHTVVGRLQYLKDQGEDLSKVLVLSFTNVAAINIKQRFTNIRSETLANMFNKIYNATYPKQTLSTTKTIANSLTMLSPRSAVFKNHGFQESQVEQCISTFKSYLLAFNHPFKKPDIPVLTKQIAQFIDQNIGLVELLLDTIGQTALELQPILIHYHLTTNTGQLIIPQEYKKINYIITDESQDISTFEYILLLEITNHYYSQLLIIGDGSQTLYEFRNSDPRYLNALESSGVFKTYKLDTNYRSREEILRYANQFLTVIEANEYANIQLHSQQYSQPSIQSFKTSVLIDNIYTPSRQPDDRLEVLKEYLENNQKIWTYLKNKIDNNEQIAFLAWTRREVKTIAETINTLLKANGYQQEVTTLLSKQQRPLTIISDILVKAKHDIQKIYPSDSQAFTNKILDIMYQYYHQQRHSHVSDKQANFHQSFIKEAVTKATNNPQFKAVIQDIRQKRIPQSAASGYLYQQLLLFEQNKNAMDSYLNKDKNTPDYNNIKLLATTIHGSKGLEFDHTVVAFDETAHRQNSIPQDALRMLFVATSRAKQSLYVINTKLNRTNTLKTTSLKQHLFKTPIQTAYLRTIEAIEQTSAQP